MATDSLPGRRLNRLDGRVVLVGGEEPDYRSAAIEFRHLRYFATVAEELHFGHAAERLFISQPALSQAIARLEGALGVRLLSRTRHSVELTEAGAELLRRARRLLADKEEAVERVRSVARGETGVLRVGVALLAEHEVAPVLTALAGVEPGLVVDRFAAVSERLLEHLREGSLDAAFVHQVPLLTVLEDLEWEVVRHGRLASLMSSANPIAGRASVRLEELAAETFLVNPRELAPSAYEGLKLMCREFGGFEPEVLESPATSSLPLGPDWRLIRDGAAIAVMAEGAARAATPAGIAVVPIEPPPPFLLALAWRRGDGSALLERFLRIVRAFRSEHAWTAEPAA
jgi:DNA-binding transcriptional LysR family regulator